MGGCARRPLHVDKCQQHYDDVTRLRIMCASVEGVEVQLHIF